MKRAYSARCTPPGVVKRRSCLLLTFQVGSQTLCKLLEADHDDPCLLLTFQVGSQMLCKLLVADHDDPCLL